jgi:endonuclease III
MKMFQANTESHDKIRAFCSLENLTQLTENLLQKEGQTAQAAIIQAGLQLCQFDNPAASQCLLDKMC